MKRKGGNGAAALSCGGRERQFEQETGKRPVVPQREKIVFRGIARERGGAAHVGGSRMETIGEKKAKNPHQKERGDL